MVMIEANKLNKTFGDSKVGTHAIKDMDFKIYDASFNAVVGPSGSGKSTLLQILSGIDIPSSGTVLYKNEDIFSRRLNDRIRLRRKEFGFVFQNFCLIPYMTIVENIYLPSLIDGKSPDDKHIKRLMNILGIEKKQDAYPNMLSGGQQQRVAIARALSTKPSILFADEPTGNLDSSSSNDVINLMKVLYDECKITVIIVTHDTKVENVCNRIIEINDGIIINDFTKEIS